MKSFFYFFEIISDRQISTPLISGQAIIYIQALNFNK